MQFLADTFDAHAVDADQDGVANPHDIDDAAATAAAYICASAGGSVDGTAEIARIYNPGDAHGYAARLDAERQLILDSRPCGRLRRRRRHAAARSPDP